MPLSTTFWDTLAQILIFSTLFFRTFVKLPPDPSTSQLTFFPSHSHKTELIKKQFDHESKKSVWHRRLSTICPLITIQDLVLRVHFALQPNITTFSWLTTQGYIKPLCFNLCGLCLERLCSECFWGLRNILQIISLCTPTQSHIHLYESTYVSTGLVLPYRLPLWDYKFHKDNYVFISILLLTNFI